MVKILLRGVFQSRQQFKSEKFAFEKFALEVLLFALELFGEKWNGKYPLIGKSWNANWQRINPMFVLSKEIRRAVHTTNVIESLNYGLRKITKIRAAFPTEEAAIKLLYLGLQNAVKRWTVPIQNWNLAMN